MLAPSPVVNLVAGGLTGVFRVVKWKHMDFSAAI